MATKENKTCELMLHLEEGEQGKGWDVLSDGCEPQTSTWTRTHKGGGLGLTASDQVSERIIRHVARVKWKICGQPSKVAREVTR